MNITISTLIIAVSIVIFAFIGLGHVIIYFGSFAIGIIHILSDITVMIALPLVFMWLCYQSVKYAKILPALIIGCNVISTALMLYMFCLYEFLHFSTLDNELSASGFNITTEFWCITLVLNFAYIIKLSLQLRDSK